MFGSWKKIMEYLEMVFDLMTKSKAELETLGSIYQEIKSLRNTMAYIEHEVILIREKLDEKEG